MLYITEMGIWVLIWLSTAIFPWGTFREIIHRANNLASSKLKTCNEIMGSIPIIVGFVVAHTYTLRPTSNDKFVLWINTNSELIRKLGPVRETCGVTESLWSPVSDIMQHLTEWWYFPKRLYFVGEHKEFRITTDGCFQTKYLLGSNQQIWQHDSDVGWRELAAIEFRQSSTHSCMAPANHGILGIRKEA